MSTYKKIRLLLDMQKNKDPYLFKRIIYNGYVRLLRLFFKIKSHKGIKIMDENWDYLLVLDACRYDVFKKVYKEYFNQGTLHKKLSVGSCTKEWLLKNFTEKANDVIYISGTPYVTRIKSNVAFDGNKFHSVKEVWIDSWQNDTTPPNEITKSILDAQNQHKDKRLIAHFLQPHTPYIGRTKIPNSVYDAHKNLKTKRFRPVHAIEDGIKYGNLDLNLVKKAYEDNLRLVLEEIQKIIRHLNGTIVITSDHGECFGEKGLYFHEVGVYTKELIEIPWFIIKKDKKDSKRHSAVDNISI